jgi:predicted permease
MGTLLQDVRYAVRVLLRAPSFTAVAVLTLALGMAANTAIFSVLDAVILEPLPYPEPQRRVMVWSRWRGFEKTWTNAYESRRYAERCPSLASVAFWRTGDVNLTGDGETVRVAAGEVTANAFEALGVAPALGRSFTAEEDRPGGPKLAVIGHALWQGRYAGDPGVVGRTVALDGVPHEIVGVMPRGFALPTDFGEDAADPTQLWVPRAAEAEEFRADYGNHGDFTVARLAPGATVARANEELRRVTRQLTDEGAFPREMEFSAFAVRLDDEIVGPWRPALLLLTGAVGLLMLVACANVANLLLARAEGRHREIAVRSALGAGRGRLARQLLTEGFVLALVAAGVSLVLAQAGLHLLRSQLPPHVPRALAAVVDGRAVAFAVALAFATTLLFGLAPALHTLRTALAESLKEGGRGAGGLARRRWRGGLIVAEIALAIVLAVGAGLMARTLHNLARIDLGLDPSSVLTVGLSVPAVGHEKPEQVTALYGRLLREVRALPGVRRAGLLRSLPLGQTIGDWGIVVEGFDHGASGHGNADWQVATGGAAEALGERLVAGRFVSDDDTAETPHVAAVNEAMARRFWPGQDPLGRRFRQGTMPGRPWITVVGVVADVRHNGMTGIVKPKFYRPQPQFYGTTGNPTRNMNLVVKAGGDPLALAAPIRDVVRRLAPEVAVANVRSMDEVVRSSIAAPRLTGSLLVLFASLALALAAVGVYGVLSYGVSERSAEIGVRMALGARPRDVHRLVLGEAAALAGAGIGGGLFAAFALARLMRSLLHEVGPADPLTFGAVAVVLGGTALLAAFVPAHRAARLAPAAALRRE